MNDAVERAKAILDDEFAPHEPKGLLRDLAAEVERLNHDLANAQVASEFVRELKKELDQSKAEVARLKEKHNELRRLDEAEESCAELARMLKIVEAERDRYKEGMDARFQPDKTYGDVIQLPEDASEEDILAAKLVLREQIDFCVPRKFADLGEVSWEIGTPKGCTLVIWRWTPKK